MRMCIIDNTVLRDEVHENVNRTNLGQLLLACPQTQIVIWGRCAEDTPVKGKWIS